MTTAADIVNEALQLMGDNETTPVTGVAPTFDSSRAGIAARQLYLPTVTAVARAGDWDFERAYTALATSGNVPPDPWLYEYVYPATAVRVWQVLPATITDQNDPLPTSYVVGNTVVAGVTTKVIWTDIAVARAVIANVPGENLWDALFHQAVVRALAASLAIALAARNDTARDRFSESVQFMQAGSANDA